MRSYDGLFALEESFVTFLHISLYDLDRTDVDSLYGLLGYMERKNEKPEVITIGRKKYKRVSADDVHF